MHNILLFLLLIPYWYFTFCFGLVVFRFNPLHFTKKISYSTAILVGISFIIQFNNIEYLTSIIQPICFIICYRIIFGFRIVHSVIKVSIIYVSLIVTEVLSSLIVSGMNLEALQGDNLMRLALMTFIIFIMCHILYSFRLGFSFISLSPYVKPKINKKLYIYGLLCLAVLPFTGLSLYFSYHLVSLFLGLVIMAMLVVVRFSYEKELED